MSAMVVSKPPLINLFKSFGWFSMTFITTSKKKRYSRFWDVRKFMGMNFKKNIDNYIKWWTKCKKYGSV